MAGRILMATPPIPKYRQIQQRNKKPSQTQNSSNSLLHHLHSLNQASLPSKSAFILAMKACALVSPIPLGKSIHAHIIKFGYQSDRFIATSIVAFYSSNSLLELARQVFDKIPHKDPPLLTSMLSAYVTSGDIAKARILFDEMPDKDVISYNAMLTGYLRCNSPDKTVELFREMLSAKIVFNEVTLVCALSACSQTGCLVLGEWIHAYVDKHLDDFDTATLRNSLINMYSKCGRLDLAFEQFLQKETKNLETWNAMLTGFAVHGRGSEAVSLFSQMIKIGWSPDKITFISLLSACSHAGMIYHARSCFTCMIRSYDIEPEFKHYNCMVDILSRKGYLEEALMVIKNMPFEVDTCALGALLSGCIAYCDYELGLDVAKCIIELEPRDEERYIALLNLYNLVGKMEDATKLRRVMDEIGIKRNSGVSVIEVDGVNHEFRAGDRSHLQTQGDLFNDA